MTVRVQLDDFDAGAEITRLRAASPQVGAVASFIGVARDMNEGEAVSALTLEHYPGMTERALQAIEDEARRRWSVSGICIIHRVGELKPLDQIVFVGVSSTHRADAFAACQFVMDYLKTEAPLWKKEQRTSGPAWVQARPSDEVAAGSWRR